MKKLSIQDVDVAGKRVLVRVDFNVPLANGVVGDDTRIQAALPTIENLRDRGARIVLLSHLGRPDGMFDEANSLDPVVARLSELLDQTVAFHSGQIIDDPSVSAAINDLTNGDIVMLENIRFYAGEKSNDEVFARTLAGLADLYVNDAFGAAHRAHASTEGVAHILPAYAGLLLAGEIDTLSSMLLAPKKPFVAILGGSKVSDKFGVIDKLIEIVDTLLIGGGMAFTFLAAQGYNIGKSLVEPDWIEPASKMIAKAEEFGCTLMLPSDIVVADAFAADAVNKVVPASEIPSEMMGLDIGPDSAAEYAKAIIGAETIFWNGPMGVFEMKAFENGTRIVAEAVAAAQGVSVIGGGDSVAALKQFGLQDHVTFISTGGGASMKLVEGAKLPGLEALLDA